VAPSVSYGVAVGTATRSTAAVPTASATLRLTATAPAVSVSQGLRYKNYKYLGRNVMKNKMKVVNWKELEESLRKIKINQKIDEKSNYREVNEIPPYKPSRGRFNGKESFRVQIGKKNYINIPIDLLKKVYDDVEKGNEYCKKLLDRLFLNLTKNRPCYTQVIKKLLEAARLQI
jgi:hypothetical protein